MTLPGSVVEIVDAAPPAATLTDTGTAFMVGLAERGAMTGGLTATDAVHSLGEFVHRHGGRQTYNGPEFDAVEAFFTEGGSRLFFARYGGPAAVAAQANIGTQFTVTANGPGAWGNEYEAGVESGQFYVNSAVEQEARSPEFTTVAEVIDWATGLNSVTVTALAPGSAALANTTDPVDLTGGTDDRANATETELQAALDRLGKELGPGSVLMPGDTRAEAHSMLTWHAVQTNRFAYCDAPDSATAGLVADAGRTVRAYGRDQARHAQVLEPWLIAPGLTVGTTRTVPPSGVMAGMAARSDATGSPNRAVAGRNGISRFAVDVKHARTDAEREELADAGITVLLVKDSVVQAYDDISAVDPLTEPEWLGAAGNRMTMRIIADAYAIADAHMFGTVGGPVDLAAFQGDLKGMLAGWFAQGSLYSRDGTPEGAFRVETGAAVNTPATLAARQLRAALAFKLSPNARQVVVQITNRPLTEAV